VPLIGRPTPEEILTGVARSLTSALAPDLSTDYAQAQLGSALGLLSYLGRQLDSAVEDLVREIEGFEAALGASEPDLRAAGEDAMGQRIGGVLATPATDLRVSTLMQRSDSLQEVLLAVLIVAEAAGERGDDALTGVVTRIRSELVGYNARRQRS
jgi:hypothetical protein